MPRGVTEHRNGGMRETGIGKSVPRTEDVRLVQGLGQYTDDLSFLDQAHLYVVRSPHASARIVSIEKEGALSSPGVLIVLTGQDLMADGIGTLPSRVSRPRPDGRPNFVPPYYALAVDRVRHVGEAVAAVVALSAEAARDAAEAVLVEYELLPAVSCAADAMSGFTVWDQAPDNICFLFELGNRLEVDQAFAAADHVAKLDYRITRVSANPIEPRNAAGIYNRSTGRYTLYAPVQSPHLLRAELAETVLGIAEADLQVIVPECGGSFGMKEAAYPEFVLVLWAARKTGRPVRWQCDRSDAFTSDYHARDNVSTVELALDRLGTFLALRVKTIANLGAYLSSYGVHSPTNNLGGLAGTYTTPHIHVSVTGVFTNTSPTSAYRGAGRPEASYAIECVIDVAAREMGIDRIELRRRNMIPPEAMPFKTGLVYTYDSGEFEANLDLALDMAKWADFEERHREAAQRGRIRGIGLASVIEIAGGPSDVPFEEFAEMRFDPGGTLTVIVGSTSQGQGHETTFKQVVTEVLGIVPERIRVTFGDTDRVAHGKGTFGSRTASVVSTALLRAADKIIKKGTVVAAGLLEAAAQDIEFSDGRFRIVGSDRGVDLIEVARAAYRREALPPGIEPGLAESAVIVPDGPTFPNGCHVCEVEIEPETGAIQVVGYWVVEDFGRVINPRLVHGQTHGGIAQGIGQANFEAIHYDEAGQLLTGSFQDYTMPRADSLPHFEVLTREVPAKTNPLGIKGAGEAGTVGALPAFMNAVNDALASLGIGPMDMPATPFRVWEIINGRTTDTS